MLEKLEQFVEKISFTNPGRNFILYLQQLLKGRALSFFIIYLSTAFHGKFPRKNNKKQTSKAASWQIRYLERSKNEL